MSETTRIKLTEDDIIIWKDGFGYFELKIPRGEFWPKEITPEQLKKEILEALDWWREMAKDPELKELKKQILEWKRFYEDYYPLYSMEAKMNPSEYMKQLKEKADKWDSLNHILKNGKLDLEIINEQLEAQVKEQGTALNLSLDTIKELKEKLNNSLDALHDLREKYEKYKQFVESVKGLFEKRRKNNSCINCGYDISVVSSIDNGKYWVCEHCSDLDLEKDVKQLIEELNYQEGKNE